MPDQCATCGAGDALLFRCEDCDRQFCTDHAYPDHECGVAATATAADGDTTGVEEGVGFEWGGGAPGTGPTNTGEGRRADPFDGSGFRPAADERDGTGESGEPPATGPRTVLEDGASAVERVVEPRAIEGSARAAVRPAGPRPRDVDHGVGVPQAVRPDTGRVPERRPVDDPEPLLVEGTGGVSDTRADGAGTSGTASTSTPAGRTPIRPMDTRASPGRTERSEPRTVADWFRQQTYVSLTVKTGAIAAAINAALYFGVLLVTSGLLERLLA